MASNSFAAKIDKLRKRSRVLLSCLEIKARKVDSGVKKWCQQNYSPENGPEYQHVIFNQESEIWKLRNDSSGVCAALCPDYFQSSPKTKSLSVPNMNTNEKILLTSNKKAPNPSESRKPNQDCYCIASNQDYRGIQYRSLRTKHKPMPACGYCKSTVDLIGDFEEPIKSSYRSQQKIPRELQDPGTQSPPLSCETMRKAQQIDYTPRSQFLRNVQSKVLGFKDKAHPQIPSPMLRRRGPDISKNQDSSGQTLKINTYPCCKSNATVNVQKSSRPKAAPRKTISSIKSTCDHRVSPSRKQRTVQLVSGDGPTCCRCEALEKDSKNYERPHEYHQRNYEKHLFEEDVKDTHKFREQNYFDTHGSSQTLLGASQGSGSLRQFRLNERLFPEVVGKVHTDDLVVSMPPCLTKQRKSLHYFPKGLVRQEKNVYGASSSAKKRRCPGCPLTGHAVDLGVLKICHPPNSLALRYQKGVP